MATITVPRPDIFIGFREVEDPLTGQTKFTFRNVDGQWSEHIRDKSGNVISHKDHTGQIIAATYSEAGMMSYSNAKTSETLAITRDKSGRVQTMTTQAGLVPNNFPIPQIHKLMMA